MLKGKRAEFVNQYFICNRNQTKAAIAAGYSEKSAYNTAYRLMKNDEIKEAIRARMDEYAMEANEVLWRLSEHARSDISDILDADGNLSMDKARKNGTTRLIKRLRKKVSTSDDWETVETEFEIYDAQSALKELAKFHDLTNKIQVDGDIKLYDKVTPDDWDE